MDYCGHPAIACCSVFGQHKNICEWHAEPFDKGNDSLAFLERSYLPVGAQYTPMIPIDEIKRRLKALANDTSRVPFQ